MEVEPTGPVSEDEEVDVQLHCLVTNGNPKTLTQVVWYKSGQLLKDQPDPELCINGNNEDAKCQDDPAVLDLGRVTREDMAHYSCIGTNVAGEGEISKETFFNVQCKEVEC